MKPRDAAVLIAAVIIGTAIFSSKPLDRLDGVSLDSLFWLRNFALGPRYKPDQSPVAVIAIDEETYRRPPFQFVPRAMWTDQIASVLDGVIGAGAKVVGFDVIFSTSVERYVKGFERKFLIALRRAARQGKVVLGKVQHEVKPVSPHPSQSFAVGHQKNIRNVNVYGDDDDVIRRVPLFSRAENVDESMRTETSMALELASRALGIRPSRTPNGEVRLGNYVVPGSADNALTINFDGGDDSIPTYSLADIYQCVSENREDFLKKHFQGKVVMIGAVLDVDDRKLTSKRLIAGHQGATSHARCVLPEMKELIRTDVSRDTIPGVYVHAAAINDLIRGDALRVQGRTAAAGMTFVFALLVGLAALVLSPSRAGIAFGALTLGWLAAATVLFQNAIVVPLFDPFAAGALVFVGMLGFRAAVSDRDKRYIRRVFSYYLPPQVIERMVSQDRLPTLGGEAKEVTILFSDIASFTTLSEGLDASHVASFLNDYLTAMSDIIEAKGGFIEKFVADEVTGVFGAPVDDPDHAANAVEAALISRERLRNMPGAFGLPPDRTITARTGINSGEMLVGNIGSHRRFNYAAMGDAANLGSRIEGVNKVYDTDILVGERTRELCGDRFEFREIDSVRVVGRATPVVLYMPICRAGELSDQDAALRREFAEALALYRHRNFTDALAAFERLAGDDPVSKVFAEKARSFLIDPPPEDWDGVNELLSK